MKFRLSVFFVLIYNSVFAANPGSNYGCEADFNHSLYMSWTSTVTASPTNPGWNATFQLYDTNPQVYTANYNPGTAPCGQANPNKFFDGGGVCFVKVGSVWQQGALKYFTVGSVVPCPIDDYIPFLFLIICVCGFYYINKRKTNFSL
jgi:hypothetical protein